MADPIFTSPRTNPFGLTDVGSFASPTFVDIDNDGDLDAFVGNRAGNTLFYRNTGTDSSPVFDTPSTNSFNSSSVISSLRSKAIPNYNTTRNRLKFTGRVG